MTNLPEAPAHTGDYTFDCRRGRDYADHLINVVEATDSPHLLGLALDQMFHDSGVRFGFMRRIADYAVAGYSLRGQD